MEHILWPGRLRALKIEIGSVRNATRGTISARKRTRAGYPKKVARSLSILQRMEFQKILQRACKDDHALLEPALPLPEICGTKVVIKAHSSGRLRQAESMPRAMSRRHSASRGLTS